MPRRADYIRGVQYQSMKHILLSLSVFIVIRLSAFAQPGTLDMTFNSIGYQTAGFGNYDDNGNAVAIQDDSKIVVAGETSTGTDFDIAVMRFNADGSVDETFANNGRATVNLGHLYDTGKSVAIQDDGKIVVAGSFLSVGYGFKMCAVRFNSDGTLDNTFASNGVDSIVAGSGSCQANAVALQDDGKIVLAGSSTDGYNLDFTIVRLNADGSLDNNFGTGGIEIFSIANADDYANGVAIQNDGKIVATGKSGNNPDVAVIRLNEDGTPDNSFSSDGKLTTNVNGNDNSFAVAIQSDDKIVVCGEAYDGVTYDISVLRYTSSGGLDNSFSGDGKATFAIGSTYEGGYDVEIQQDGKILVCGKTATTSAADNVALIRLKTDGTLDAGFGSNGKVSTDIAGYGDASFGMALQDDGNIVLAGFSNNGVNNDFLVLRYVAGLGVGITQPDIENVSLRLYPNPVTDQVILCYTLQKSQPVSVTLEDVTGRVIQILANHEMRTAGKHDEVISICSSLCNGTYVLRFQTGDVIAAVPFVH